MSVKEYVIHTLHSLSEAECQQVAEYLAFLKFRSRTHSSPSLDTTKIAALYAEFADEDRELVEEGMTQYGESLLREDAQ